MSISSDWELCGVTSDGRSFHIGGLDVWRHEWRDTHERAHVKDPRYGHDFTFHVYEIDSGDRVVAFAAGEFSPCMWGFYVRRRDDA